MNQRINSEPKQNIRRTTATKTAKNTMTRKAVFQTYQNPEIGKKGKQVTSNIQQVSQFSLFPPFGEIKNHDLSLEKLKLFLGEDWNDYKNNPEALEFWADLLFINQLIEQGKCQITLLQPPGVFHMVMFTYRQN